MAAPTPVTDGGHVYALFATGDLVCYSKDGELAWYRSLVGDYPTVGTTSASPSRPSCTTHADRLPRKCRRVVRGSIDIRTGQNRWRIERPRGINWVTPLVIKNGDRDEVLLQVRRPHRPRSRHRQKALEPDRVIGTAPSPVWADGKVFTAGGKFLAVRPGSETEKPVVAWESRSCVPVIARRCTIRAESRTLGRRHAHLRRRGDRQAAVVAASGDA